MLEDREAWLALEPYERDYHLHQYDNPCGYAASFIGFLERNAGFACDSTFRVLDIGTGAGGHLHWIAKRFPRCTFVGIDINPELIAVARQRHDGCTSTSFEVLDLDDSAGLGRFDWIVSLQVMSWLKPELAKRSLLAQMDSAIKGIAMTALLTTYDADYSITVADRAANKLKPVSILGLNGVACLAETRGWRVGAVEDIELAVDLKDEGRPRDFRTVTTADGHRLAFAGDVYMPWRQAVLTPDSGRSAALDSQS